MKLLILISILIPFLFINLSSNKPVYSSNSSTCMLNRGELHYDGDFTVNNNSNYQLKLTFELASLPFEGSVDSSYLTHMRIDQIQNGSRFRFYPHNGNLIYWPLFYVHKIGDRGTLMDAGHCYGTELEGANCEDSAWGYAKYKITIEVTQTGEKYVCYFNCLDSKYGKAGHYGHNYRQDWGIEYNDSLTLYYRVRLKEAGTGGFIFDSLSTFEVKEFKPWKIIYGRNEPWERKFYARTTPFGVPPFYIDKNYNRNLVLGTTVILDTVYNNKGNNDKYGYNTVDTIGGGGQPGSFDNYPYYYSHPPIDEANFQSGNTYTTPGWFYFDYMTTGFYYGMKITAEQGDELWLKNSKGLWVTGREDFQTPGTYRGDTICLNVGSTLRKETNSQVSVCFGGRLIDYGANTVWNPGSFHKAYRFSSLEYYGSPDTVNSGGHIEIKGNATLKLGDNTTLIFAGSNTYLKLDSNSQVVLGNNAQIKFINGAYLDANKATFNNPNGYWQGIVLENAGANTKIRNCTFNKAVKALNFNNTSTAVLDSAIYNNIFNVSAIGGMGIYARNLYNATFSHNTFNLSSGVIGAIIQNSYNPPEPGDGYASELKFINNNIFTGGYIQLFIGGYATNNIPVLVDGNTFTNGGWCFVGRMITGNVKNNSMKRSASNYAAWLWQSNPNMTNDSIRNDNGSAFFISGSYPILKPTLNQNEDLVWFGGNNNFKAVNGDAINIRYSKPVLDNGANNIIISSNSFYHLYGMMDGTDTFYNARNNCWYYNSGTGTPRIYVYRTNYVPVSVNVTGTIICNTQINYNSFILNDHGDGVYDTVWISDNFTSTPASEDEILYTQACTYRTEGSYFEAITDFKNLINNYEESEYIYTSLYNLYACYEGLDTADQSHRDLIFGDLKFYLENKILQYTENDEFVSIAYNLILMCEAMIENYNEAMTGYEFISLYHPDPDQRMLASMDYGEVMNLINGMSGGEGNKTKVTKKVNILKLMDKKPYTKIVKNLFLKGTRELEKKLNDKNLRDDKTVIRNRELIERARQNINVSRSLTREQREERRMEDIRLLITENPDNGNYNSNNVPLSYNLHQNYPNPFNPTTTIKYELPNDGMITFKIYDILGKEIYSINEFRKVGIHEIKFDGSNYASGVYFYRIETGSFIDTKKMVLIK